ncbi:acyltransferase family protein [Priestia megaterium]|uniref:acyltransferase family protein n=1 Tax=Priestia megaterium TaxID=1404 RepID=UPI0039E925D9
MYKKRLSELDSLRGIAALSVMLYHYLTRYNELFSNPNDSIMDFKYGKYGVNLFFIISGFVIYMSISHQTDIKNFIVKRVIRLYPAYIFAVILTFMVIKIYSLPGRGVSLKEALLNLTMVQGFIPGINNVDGVYWTLTIEVTFYIIIAFLIIVKLINRITIVSITWLIIASFIQILSTQVESNILNIVNALIITKYFHLFIIGIMFYKLREQRELKYYVVIVTCLFYELIFKYYVSNVLVTVFIIGFFCLINNKLGFLNHNFLIFLGTISYPLYLIHQNIGYVVINLLDKVGLDSNIIFLIPILISLAIATFITFCVEKPIQRYLHRKLHNLQNGKYNKSLSA